LNDLDLAIEYPEKAVETALKIRVKDTPAYAADLGLLANLYGEKGQYKLSKKLLRQSLSILKSNLHESHQDVTNIYVYLSEVFDHENMPDSSLHYSILAYSVNALLPVDLQFRRNYYTKQLAEGYFKNGRLDSAKLYMDKLLSTNGLIGPIYSD